MSIHAPDRLTPAPLAIEERREARLPLHLPAYVISPGDVRSAAIVSDISTLGCRVQADVRVRVGRYLGLHIPGLAPYSGWVAWQTREEFGLDFCHPLPPAVVAHISGLGTREGAVPQAPQIDPSSSG